MKLNEIKKLTDGQINKMTLSEIKAATTKLITQANRNLRNIENKNLQSFSPAYQFVKNEYGGRFSIAGKTLNQVRKIFYDVKNFLYNPHVQTGTVRGTQAYLNKMSNYFKVKPEELLDISDKNLSNFWQHYREFSEKYNGKIKYDVITTAFEKYGESKRKGPKTIEKIFREMDKLAMQEYLKEQEQLDDIGEFDGNEMMFEDDETNPFN